MYSFKTISLRHSVLLLAVCFALAGCGGSGVNLAPVTGVITNDGKPVEGAMIEFFPEDGRASVGATNAAGEYTLKYSDDAGAVIGTCRVQITPGIALDQPDETGGTEGQDLEAPPMSGPPEIIQVPQKVTVKKGDNKFDFDLSELKK